MKTFNICLLAVTCALLAGCAKTRSISNSSYQDEHTLGYMPRANGSDPGFAYRGELSEFDVLGIARGQMTTDEDIQHALDNAKSVTLNANSSILLIQSGAMFPDAPMVNELSKHFRVTPFSGVPTMARNGRDTIESRNPESFAQSLRLAAA